MLSGIPFRSHFNVNECVLSWPEDGRLRPKHVAKYNLIVIITSCLDLCCVLTAHNIQFDIHNGMPPPSLSLSLSKKSNVSDPLTRNKVVGFY